MDRSLWGSIAGLYRRVIFQPASLAVGTRVSVLFCLACSFFFFFLPARSSASALPILTVSAGVSPPPLTGASQSRGSAEPPSPALANQKAPTGNRQARCHCE